MEKKSCLVCGSLIEGKNSSNKKYCSRICSRNLQKNLYRNNNPIHDLSAGTVGCISELEICVDLLIKGFEVYRAISGSASCDLAVLKNKKLFRIEVTTGFIQPNGKIRHTTKDNNKFDVLAVITRTGSIHYFPELETLGV